MGPGFDSCHWPGYCMLELMSDSCATLSVPMSIRYLVVCISRVPDSRSSYRSRRPDFGKDAQDLLVFHNETTRLVVLHTRRTPKMWGRIWDPVLMYSDNSNHGRVLLTYHLQVRDPTLDMPLIPAGYFQHSTWHETKLSWVVLLQHLTL